MSDLIEREAVIKLAYDMSEIDGEHFIEPRMVVDVEDIQKLLPVMSQPKHEIDHEYCENCLHVEMCKWYGYTGCEFKDTYEDIAKEYVRPNGHWIIHEDTITLLTGNSATGGVICSECGYKTYNKVHVMVGCPYKYCPSCGSYNGGDDNGRQNNKP